MLQEKEILKLLVLPTQAAAGAPAAPAPAAPAPAAPAAPAGGVTLADGKLSSSVITSAVHSIQTEPPRSYLRSSSLCAQCAPRSSSLVRDYCCRDATDDGNCGAGPFLRSAVEPKRNHLTCHEVVAMSELVPDCVVQAAAADTQSVPQTSDEPDSCQSRDSRSSVASKCGTAD